MIRVVGVGATGITSGAERVMIRYAHAAIADGIEFTIASPQGRLSEVVIDEGIGYVELPDLKLDEGNRALETARLGWRNLLAVGRLRSALRDADVVIVNSLMALPAVVAARPAAPVHWLVHDVVTRGDLKAIVKLVAGRLDGAIAVSEASAQYPRAVGIDTVVVRNGVPFPDEGLAPELDPPIVGINAVLTDWKGQDVFLDALGLVTEPWRAEILGGALPKDGPYEEQLRARAQQPDVDGRVEFLGHRDDTVAVMRRWSIAVSASREPEAGPLVVSEAMALGTAVVVTDHGGAPETLGSCGIAVPPEDPAAMAEAITTYLRDADRRAVDGTAARQRASDLLRIETACAAFVDRVRAIAAKPASGGAAGSGRR